MNVSDLKILFEFNRWANAKTLQSVESLSPEKIFEETKSSFGTIHGTLVHYCGAEDIWLQRLTGVSPTVFMNTEQYPTFDSLKTKWKEVEDGFEKLLPSLSDTELQREFVITTQKGDRVSQKVWQSLQHLVNHSTYHRGQITTLVRQLGGTPVGTDMINFFRQKNAEGNVTQK